MHPMGRYDNLHRIEQMDPVRDNGQICRLIAGYEFPWDVTRALEVALFRTFCIPSISQLLNRTGEFRRRPQKRYDDTALLISSIIKWGYDSPQGAEAIQRMNRIHGHFKIGNADFLYVLSTFIYEPIRWIGQFGWRPLSEKEKLGFFYFWQAVGERMEIQEIPPTYEAFERFMVDYERQHLQYSESNRHVGQATLDLFLSWFPSFLHPLLTPCVYALLDDTMLDAFGFPHPLSSIRQLVSSTLKLRGNAVKMLPARTKSDFYADKMQRSYPRGQTLADLGPPDMLDFLNHPLDK